MDMILTPFMLRGETLHCNLSSYFKDRSEREIVIPK